MPACVFLVIFFVLCLKGLFCFLPFFYLRSRLGLVIGAAHVRSTGLIHIPRFLWFFF